jgi:hypothetical protein
LFFNPPEADKGLIPSRLSEPSVDPACGAAGWFIVAQTALHAHPDYAVHVVSDAVSSRALHNRDVALHRMRQQGITVTSTEMVIYELLEKQGPIPSGKPLNWLRD